MNTLAESSLTSISTTTARRELLGWCGSMTWLFLMMYAYDVFIRDSMSFLEGGSWLQFFFMLLLALSIALFSYRFGRDPDSLGKIAFYSAPIAMGITIALGFISDQLFPAFYLLSAVLMAPVITRRVYGIIRTTEPTHRILSYMAGFSVSFLIFAVWIALSPLKEIALFVPALLCFPAWFRVRRNLTIPDGPPVIVVFRLAKWQIFTLAAAMVLFFCLASMGRMVLTLVFAGGGAEESNAALDALVAWVPAALVFLLYSVINDKGHERISFICFLGLSLLGSVFALLPGIPTSAVTLVLIITFCFGEMYVEFLAYTTPLYFLINAKKPVFIASIGCVLYLIMSALTWKIEIWLPKIFFELDIPLFVSLAVSTVIFILLVHFLFERHREKTLAAALYSILYNDDAEKTEPEAGLRSDKKNELFTPEEIDVAMLLIEGKMRSEITRSLHLSAEEANKRIGSIRSKVSNMGDPDPFIAAAIAEYKLTPRETDMLRCLRRKMSNAEVAAELFLAEETVRIHVRNLLKKLNVDARKGIAPWIEAFEKKKTSSG